MAEEALHVGVAVDHGDVAAPAEVAEYFCEGDGFGKDEQRGGVVGVVADAEGVRPGLPSVVEGAGTYLLCLAQSMAIQVAWRSWMWVQ